jgi:hypothetical protein
MKTLKQKIIEILTGTKIKFTEEEVPDTFEQADQILQLISEALPKEVINGESEEVKRDGRIYATKDYSFGWNDYRQELISLLKGEDTINK